MVCQPEGWTSNEKIRMLISESILDRGFESSNRKCCSISELLQDSNRITEYTVECLPPPSNIILDIEFTSCFGVSGVLVCNNGVYFICNESGVCLTNLRDGQIFSIDGMKCSLEELRSDICLWDRYRDDSGMFSWRLSIEVLIEPGDLPTALV